LLQRKQFFIEDYSCVLCDGSAVESRTHLLFHCPFAKACWHYVCPSVNINNDDNHLECISKLRSAIDKPYFMEIIILCTWSIWLTRNSYIFNNLQPSLYRCRAIFKSELN
jgi:hypothetical protein